MEKKRILPVILLIFLITLPVNSDRVSPYVEIKNSHTELEILITFANYTDADFDGIEDDVIGQWDVKVDSDYEFVYYQLVITLTLPSGTQFFDYLDIISNNGLHHFTLYMLGTATEPGWYNFAVTGRIFNHKITEGTAYYDFDPPEVVGSGDPAG